MSNEAHQQQQQVYFKLRIAYKACARNKRRLFEAGTRSEKKENSINMYIY